MKLLAIDTVTEYCSVALLVNGEIVVREGLAAQQHTQLILPMVQAVLAETGTSLSQMDAIVFDRGPGSFTGLRVGAGVVQGLALGTGLPVIPVSSLQTLAQSAYRTESAEQVIAGIDARQGEVYWACFNLDNGLMTNVQAEYLMSPDKIRPAPKGNYFGVGTGFSSYENELGLNTHVTLTGFNGTACPLAQDMLPFATLAWKQGRYVDATAALPVYLRDKVATPQPR